MTGRHRDDATVLRDLADEVLAVCPSCGGCVRVVAHGDVRRAACPACAWAREERPVVESWGGPHDPFLGLPLWLQVPCAGEVLWAFNAAHLAILEAYAGAGLRERTGDRRSQSLVERLPAWLKSAKHRDDVLAGLRRLRERLAAS